MTASDQRVLELESEIEKVKSQLHSDLQDNEEARASRESELEAEVRVMQQGLQGKADELAVASEKSQKMEEDNAVLIQELASVKEALSRAEETLSADQQEIEGLNVIMATLSEETRAKTEKLAQLEHAAANESATSKEKESLKQELNSVREELGRAQQCARDLQGEMDEFKAIQSTALSDAQDEIEKERQLKEESVKGLNERCAELEVRLIEAHEQLAQQVDASAELARLRAEQEVRMSMTPVKEIQVSAEYRGHIHSAIDKCLLVSRLELMG